MAARMQTDGQKVRDSSHYTGQRRISDSFRLLIKKHFPDIENKVYRVPPLFLGRSNVMSERQKSKHTQYSGVECSVYDSNYTYVFGDQAEMRVAECIENLLKEDNSGPALILTSYKFKNFFDNNYKNEKGKSDGESDITIIHQTYGCIFIEVKSAKTDIAIPLKTAIKGCKKNMSFFKENFGFSSFATVAVPNVPKQNLAAFIKECKSLVDYFKYDEQKALTFCLYDDNLPSYNPNTRGFHEKEQLKQWWDSVKAEVKQKNLESPGFTMEKYKYIFERFVGEKSTVEARSFGQSILAVGNRCENVVLTPAQVTILNSDTKRLIIRGGYGTGKTTMLILKCRELIKLGKKVCVISMANSPLIDVLEASIRHDLAENYTQNVMFMSAESQSDLSKKLTEMFHEQRNIFIDEFPSELIGDKTLSSTFATHPDLMLWCIMAREKLEALSKGVRDIFKQEDMWAEFVLKQVLRCPPVISSLYTLEPYTLITNYKQGHLNDTTDELTCVAECFYSSGLVTEKIERLAGTNIKKSNIDSLFKWCGLKVVDASNTRYGTFHSLLERLGVPLTQQLENQPVAQYTNDILRFSSGSLEAFTGPSFIIRLIDNERTRKLDIPYEIDRSQDEEYILMMVLDKLGVTTVQMDIELKNKCIMDRPKPKLTCLWPDIIFIEKLETYVFLEKLGIPVTTNKESRDCALFTNSEDTSDSVNCFTIRFDGSHIEVRHPRLEEGPHIRHIDHVNHVTLDHCTTCQDSLKSIFRQLDVDHSSKMPDVSWDDIIILDARGEGMSAKEFFRKCVPVLIDRTEDDSIATLKSSQDANGVLYTRTSLFQGMERKVVVVLRTPGEIRSPIENNRITDHIELAISRCTSLLILINSDQ